MKKKNTYNSVRHKSFRHALIHILETQFRLIGSGRVLEVLADMVLDLINKYLPERIKPGKTVIAAISKDAPKGHHRGLDGLPKVPVKLDVITKSVIDRYANNEKVRNIKKDYVIGLFKQAYDQGGVLSTADVAILTKMSSATISKYVKNHMDTHDDIVPTRGFIHDIGPSISHKGIIVGKFLRGELPNHVAKTTNHSQQAVDRYIKDYERVKICAKRKMDNKTIRQATGMSIKLIEKYTELFTKYEGDTHDH